MTSLKRAFYQVTNKLPAKSDIRPVTPVLAVQLLLSLPIPSTLPRLIQFDRRHLVALG